MKEREREREGEGVGGEGVKERHPTEREGEVQDRVAHSPNGPLTLKDVLSGGTALSRLSYTPPGILHWYPTPAWKGSPLQDSTHFSSLGFMLMVLV